MNESPSYVMLYGCRSNNAHSHPIDNNTQRESEFGCCIVVLYFSLGCVKSSAVWRVWLEQEDTQMVDRFLVSWYRRVPHSRVPLLEFILSRTQDSLCLIKCYMFCATSLLCMIACQITVFRDDRPSNPRLNSQYLRR